MVRPEVEEDGGCGLEVVLGDTDIRYGITQCFSSFLLHENGRSKIQLPSMVMNLKAHVISVLLSWKFRIASGSFQEQLLRTISVAIITIQLFLVLNCFLFRLET